MFIGRTKELATLEKAWGKNEFQFLVMYGRCRVGKSMLLTHFAENKHGIYHLAQETSPKIALEQFSKSVEKFTGQIGLNFSSWEEALESIAAIAESRRIFLIIDEFPYLAESDTSLLSLMQNYIDTKLKNKSLLLILCGSTVSFMEREVLGVKSPLFGRRTGQMRIEPFDYLTGSLFVPNFSNSDKAMTYYVFGGTPHYLAKLDDSRSLAENIIENVLDSHSYLYDEPTLLLKQELREPAIYNAVIEAIASGSSRLNDISTRIGEDISKCGKYLKTLIDLGVVLRQTPIGSKPGAKKTLYSLSDPFFSFWYTFVFPHRTRLMRDSPELIYEEEISRDINQYAGRLFERICEEFLQILNSRRELPFVFRDIGRWWGTCPKTKSQVEIDLVAYGRDNEVLVGECKWTNDLIDMQSVNNFLEKCNTLPNSKKHYVMFSKSGYTKAVIEKAQQQDVLLFELDDLFTILPL